MVVVCGEALIDVIHNGEGTQRAVPGGGPFNAARALARLGTSTAFLGRLSGDPLGRRLAEQLQADGVSTAWASQGPEPTTMALAKLSQDGHAEYEFRIEGTSAPNLTTAMIPDDLGPEVIALHAGSLGLALEPMARSLAELIEREGGRRLVMLDPNVRPGLVPDSDYRLRLEHAIDASTIVKASDADLGWLYPDTCYEEAVTAILDRGVRLVVVTLGPEGAFGATSDARVRVGAPTVDVADTVGAGDAFGAAILADLADHEEISIHLSLGADRLRSLLEFACEVAAITCTRTGADPPWRSELATRGSH